MWAISAMRVRCVPRPSIITRAFFMYSAVWRWYLVYCRPLVGLGSTGVVLSASRSSCELSVGVRDIIGALSTCPLLIAGGRPLLRCRSIFVGDECDACAMHAPPRIVCDACPAENHFPCILDVVGRLALASCIC